jgi:hypothetical protein
MEGTSSGGLNLTACAMLHLSMETREVISRYEVHIIIVLVLSIVGRKQFRRNFFGNPLYRNININLFYKVIC